tara:strand:+ start:2481 stop:3488 length:1008 start_codon:yes stop_codon:yes gene_type:complete
MEIKNRYVIGTHVMWYEIEMYADFVDGLVNLLEPVTNKENVIIDLCFNASQKFEQIVDTEDIYKLKEKFLKGVSKIKDLDVKVVVQVKGMPHQEDEFYFHADYRRDLNYNYCKKVDFVMWGETDSFFPREAFQAIDSLKEYTDGIGEHKYIACFSDRKMWDSSWDATVHKDYVDIKFVDDDEGHLNPNQAKSPLPIETMNEINSKIEQFDLNVINYPKIDGSCLVMSADLIKSGVNVPLCLIYNDDDGLGIMAEKLLQKDYKQFIIKNLLKVHARRHPQKRLYVKHEDNPHSFGGDKNNDFQKFLKLSQENIYKLRTGKGKFKEYDDLKKILESK